MKNSKFFVFLGICLLGLGLASCGEQKPAEPEKPVEPETENTFGEGITDEEKLILAKISQGDFTKAEFTATDVLLNKYEVKVANELSTIIYEAKGVTAFIPAGFKVYTGVDVKTFKITGLETVGTLTTHGQDEAFKDNTLGMIGTDGETLTPVAGSTVTAKAIQDAAKAAVKAVKDEMVKPVEPNVPVREKFTISFDLNGGVGPFAATKVTKGEVFNRPNTDPVKENYNFIGWFIKGTDDKYDFTLPVNDDVYLVARYQSIYTAFRGEILKAPKVPANGKVIIPASIDGETITTLGDNLFAGNKDLKEIVIPETVKTIKFSAFEGCTSLTKFSVKSTLDENGEIEKNLEFGINVFKGCTSMTEFNVPERTITLGTSTFEGCTGLKKVTFAKNIDLSNDLFKDCTSLRTVEFANDSNNAIKLGQRAFLGCTSLNEFINFNVVSELGQDALANCTGLTALNFGANFKRFGIDALKGDLNLKTITVAEENKDFQVLNNALYNKRMTKLEYVCNSDATTFEFPKDTTSYNNAAFDNCQGLKEFTVAEGNTKFVARAGLLFEKSYSGMTLKNIPTAFVGDIVLEGQEKFTSALKLGKFAGINSITLSPEQTSGFVKIDGCLYTSTYMWQTKEYVAKELVFVDRNVTGIVKLATTCDSIDEYALNGSKLDGIVITNACKDYSGNKEAIDVDLNSFYGVKDDFKIYVPEDYVTTYELQWNLKGKENLLGLKYLQKTPYVEPTPAE